MRLEVKNNDHQVLVNGKRIVLYELSSIDLFSKNELELDSLMKLFQEFFHALKDIKMQIIIKSRLLKIDDIREHFNMISSDDHNTVIYIQDLISLIGNNEIPFKKYYLVFTNLNNANKSFIDSLQAKLVQMGFSLRQIKHKELIIIAKEIFNA